MIPRSGLAAGYRPPKPDGTAGGNAKPDIYLANIGDDDLFGYCTTDDPSASTTGPYDAWAYCVLDNDFPCGPVGYDFPRTPGSWRRPPPGSRTRCTTRWTTT